MKHFYIIIAINGSWVKCLEIVIIFAAQTIHFIITHYETINCLCCESNNKPPNKKRSNPRKFDRFLYLCIIKPLYNPPASRSTI